MCSKSKVMFGFKVKKKKKCSSLKDLSDRNPPFSDS